MTFSTVALISCIGVLELSIIPAWRGITAGTPLRNKLLDLSQAGMEYSAPLTAPYNRMLAETHCNNIWLDMWESEKKANIVLAAFHLVQLIPQDREAIIKGIVHSKCFNHLLTLTSFKTFILLWNIKMIFRADSPISSLQWKWMWPQLSRQTFIKIKSVPHTKLLHGYRL